MLVPNLMCLKGHFLRRIALTWENIIISQKKSFTQAEECGNRQAETTHLSEEPASASISFFFSFSSCFTIQHDAQNLKSAAE